MRVVSWDADWYWSRVSIDTRPWVPSVHMIQPFIWNWVNETLGGTHFHLNGFVQRLVLTQMWEPTLKWPINISAWIFHRNVLFFAKKCSYSATTVFPADVCADTKTDWLFSKHFSDSFWNGSRMKGYSWQDKKQTGCLELAAHSSLVG